MVLLADAVHSSTRINELGALYGVMQYPYPMVWVTFPTYLTFACDVLVYTQEQLNDKIYFMYDNVFKSKLYIQYTVLFSVYSDIV